MPAVRRLSQSILRGGKVVKSSLKLNRLAERRFQVQAIIGVYSDSPPPVQHGISMISAEAAVKISGC